jgi:hypothetical protein
MSQRTPSQQLIHDIHHGRRFTIRDAPPEGCEADDRTLWWDDTARPLPEGGFVAVQVYADKDPNAFVRVEGLRLLFTDQAEYYFVCPGCYTTFANMQWSGGTRGGPAWRQRATASLAKHQLEKGWCSFCDPVFGNGGWLR